MPLKIVFFISSSGASGTLAVTEAGDTFAASGNVGHTGALAVTEAGDTFAASGNVGHTGTLAVTEAGDTFAADGNVGHSGTLTVTEVGDTFAAVGTVGHTGTLAVTEAGDTFVASGTTGSAPVVPPLPTGGAGRWVLRKPEKRRTLDEIVESGVREAYAALRGEAPPEVKKQIKAVVKPFVEPEASVPVKGTPKPADIDWAALERDAVRLARLIDLLEREAIEQEDEELLILSLM